MVLRGYLQAGCNLFTISVLDMSLVAAMVVAIILEDAVTSLDTVDPYKDMLKVKLGSFQCPRLYCSNVTTSECLPHYCSNDTTNELLHLYSSNDSLVAFDITGHVDKSVTLRCRFLTAAHNRGWFKITWYRMEPDGSALSLVSLSARHKVPEWSPKLPDALKSRVQPSITIQPGHVEFNIIINNLTCSDEGDYRCTAITPRGELSSSAELDIYGSPQTPDITYKLIPPSQPTRIEATCRADVGFPSKMLVWYYKRHDSSYFTIVDNQPDVVKESDGCHTVSTRTVDVIINSDNRGTHFRCGYPGYIEKEGMYDELTVDMYSQEIEDERADGKMAAICEAGPCGVGDTSPGLNLDNQHSRANLLGLNIIMMCTTVAFTVAAFLV